MGPKEDGKEASFCDNGKEKVGRGRGTWACGSFFLCFFFFFFLAFFPCMLKIGASITPNTSKGAGSEHSTVIARAQDQLWIPSHVHSDCMALLSQITLGTNRFVLYFILFSCDTSKPEAKHNSSCVCVCVCVWGGGGGRLSDKLQKEQINDQHHAQYVWPLSL